MKTPIKITVCGLTGAGKSTVSQIITDALATHGIAVTSRRYFRTEGSDAAAVRGTLAERAKALADKRTDVEIVEITANAD